MHLIPKQEVNAFVFPFQLEIKCSNITSPVNTGNLIVSMRFVLALTIFIINSIQHDFKCYHLPLKIANEDKRGLYELYV